MLRNIDPPLGFGKKCPERLAYKKLIRMNMPMDFEGKVRKLFLFASTSAIQNLIYLHFSSCKHFHRVSKFEQAIKIVPFVEKKIFAILSLSNTLPLLHCQPNRMELRSVYSYIQILCRFQKCKQKVPPPSLLSNTEGTFCLHFWNLHKIWI